MPEAKRREARHGTLAAMIDDMLFQQYIRKNCPPANPQDIAQELAKMQDGLKQSGKTVEEFCKDNGSSIAELRDDIGDIVRWRTLIQSRTTDAELQRYYTENKDFFDQIAVRASHILIRVAATAPDAEKQAAIAKLKALRAEIVAGKLDFAQAAKTHSQCPTAPNGGDLNFFPRKFMVDEAFARTAFAMKVGDVSDVVQTEFGYHLIKVTDRKAGEPSDFAKMKNDVREVYALELRNTIVMQQRKVSKVEVNLP
jgi:peptidyl-prolyl cis-trans isomerase C